MQVKVFEASDMASGLRKVKKALGPDAMILSTRTIRKGKMGMLSKPMMEITAAIDNQWQDTPASTPASKSNNQSMQFKQNQHFAKPPENDDLSYDEIWNKSQSQQRSEKNISKTKYATEEDSSIKNELNELRNLVHGLSKKLSDIDSTTQRRQSIPFPPTNKLFGSSYRPVLEILHNLGVNDETAQTIANFTMENLPGRELPNPDLLFSFLSETIAGLFTVNKILTDQLTEQKRIALVGPTGVGKTTTIAKIAANYLSKHDNNIGLITIDTYRIAAVEQLKVYGEIMNLPVEVVIKPEALDLALEKFKNKDLILIDTAGRNPRNSSDMMELTNFLRPHMGIENHLVLSATTREQEMDEAIELFQCLNINNIIYSKIDECKLLGILLNMHIKNETPISFLTNGQRVPEDIITPDPQTVSSLIMDNYRTFDNV